MPVQTMAMLITEDTYPIAVACLPETFRKIYPPKTYGMVLVLNEHVEVKASGMPIENRIENNVMTDQEIKQYFDTGPYAPVLFHKIDHKQLD